MTTSRLRSVLSVILYILLFYSIFDVYYTSPLVHRGSYERPSVPSLVKTVVFIVADGLRYDKLYTEDMEDTPTLRRLMRNEGVWGFSHTRVPTESRPGHVAMFAGFYEDVASITKGWQANAVEFDSIFNRSYRAFAWGGPDVVPMFQPLNRVGDERVKIESYPHEMLDFTAENLTQVDDWVVDKFANFMANSSHLLHSTSAESEDVSDGFRKGNFLFLHLSAADQMGHTKKPGSEEYLELVRHLDKNIARILSIFERHLEISQDSAFIFTADHGMTDWGSHGAGSDHETITPLIVWGKHIPRPASPFKLADLSPTTKSFSRIDIRQADLCPLIACLLGVPIPAHSIGELPLELLDLDPSLKVGLIRENALHALKQLHIKYEEQKASHYHLFFREFSKFSKNTIQSMLEKAALQTSNQDYSSAIITYRQIIELGLEGLTYYHKYDRFFMGICIGLSYAVWSLLLYLDTFAQSDVQPTKQQQPVAWILMLSACIIIIFLVGLSNAFHQSLLRSFYQLLPLILGLILLLTPKYREGLSDLLWNGLFSLASSNRGMFNGVLLLLLFILMEFALWGFFHRILLSFGGILLGLWPYLDPTFITLQNRAILQRLWLVACCILAIFPSLPVVGSHFSPTLVLCSSICISSAALALLKVFLKKSDSSASWLTKANDLLVFESASSGLLVFLVRNLVDWSIPVPILIHVVSWALLVTSPVLALFNKTPAVCERLIAISLAFFIPFNLLNMSYEGFFFLTLSTTVFMWIWLESGLQLQELFSLKSKPDSIKRDSEHGGDSQMIASTLRRPFFYVFFVIYAFFGTGNIASVNTFDPVSVYCFITVLSPSIMGALLIFKMICPIVMVGTSYALLGYVKSDTSAASSRREITVLMIIANFLAVHFFAMLRDEGSWLDIGESISHYVIAMSIGLASVLLSHVGSWMLTPPWMSRCDDTKLS